MAVHDIARPSRAVLPSVWRAAEQAAALRAAQVAAAAAAAAAQAAQEAQQAQQEQQAQELLQQQQAQAAQAAQALRDQRAKEAKQAAATTTTQPAHQSQPVNSTSAGGNSSWGGDIGGVWLDLRLCESGDNYAEDTGNGFYGAYQFALSTWWGLGYGGLPSDAAPAVQDQAAERLQAEAGWGQWPACSADLGL